MKQKAKPKVGNTARPTKAVKKVASKKSAGTPPAKADIPKSAPSKISPPTTDEDHANAGSDLIFFD